MKHVAFIFGLLVFLAIGSMSHAQVGTQYRGNCANKQFQISTTIASGQTTSPVIDLDCFKLVGIMMPSAFTGTSISFVVSDSRSGTFVPLYNTSGASLAYGAAANRFLMLDSNQMLGIRYVKIVSNATEGQADTLTLFLKGF